jgi:hypothetical protein
MLERIIRGSALTLVACIALSGCSSFSKTGRQQAAQRKYLRKIREARRTEQRQIIVEKTRALSNPPAPGGWATNVTMDPAQLPPSAPPETAAPEKAPESP